MVKIKTELGNGEKVIIDTTNLRPENIAQLLQELQIQGLMKDIIVWP